MDQLAPKKSRKKKEVGRKKQGVLHGYFLWLFENYGRSYGVSEGNTLELIVTDWSKAREEELAKLGLSLKEYRRATGGGDIVDFQEHRVTKDGS